MERRPLSRVPDLHAYLGEFNPFGLKAMVDQWAAAGVGWIVGVGYDVETSEAATEAAWALPNTVAGVGLHPKRIGVDGAPPAEAIEAIAELATDPQVAVISDVGVDESADAPPDLQEEVFLQMIDVALANERSVLIHWNRSLGGLLETWDRAIRNRPLRAAILSFGGRREEAQELVDRGFYFSISPEAMGVAGPAAMPGDALSVVPEERLFIHSNARAGKPESTLASPMVHDLLGRLASRRGIEPETLAARIDRNFWEFLAWRPK